MNSEVELLTLCQQNQLSIGCAESCTGGALAARITQIPGASECFHGAIVSYTDEVKKHCLGVKPSTLEQFSAVSHDVAKEMAVGALEALKVDYAVATTGIAGPSGGNEQTPVGTVFIAVAHNSTASVELFRFEGTRADIIQQACECALLKLITAIKTSK